MKNIFKYTLAIIILLLVMLSDILLPLTTTEKTSVVDNSYAGVMSIYDAGKQIERTEDVTIHLKGHALEKKLTLMGKITNIGKKHPMQPIDICRVTLEFGENTYDLVLWKNNSKQYTDDFMMYKNEGFEDTFHITVSEDFEEVKIKGDLTEKTNIISSIEVNAVKSTTDNE